MSAMPECDGSLREEKTPASASREGAEAVEKLESSLR